MEWIRCRPRVGRVRSCWFEFRMGGWWPRDRPLSTVGGPGHPSNHLSTATGACPISPWCWITSHRVRLQSHAAAVGELRGESTIPLSPFILSPASKVSRSGAFNYTHVTKLEKRGRLPHTEGLAIPRSYPLCGYSVTPTRIVSVAIGVLRYHLEGSHRPYKGS